MACLTLVGESCFTPSEAQKLKTLINKTAPIKVAAISGVWVYYARIDGDAAAAQQQLVQLLPLPAESATPSHNLNSGHDRKWYIAPRYNSPWSTKATSIAHVCGMDKTIHRIERGRTVTIEFEQPYNDKTVPFPDVLHDRMTETMAEAAPNLSVMFAEGQPQPLEVVDIFAAGQTPVQALDLGRH